MDIYYLHVLTVCVCVGDEAGGAAMEAVPLNTQSALVNATCISQNPSAISNTAHPPHQDEDDSTESKSTTFDAIAKINFNKPFCPAYQKKSFESDSILGLMTESGSESLNCDSAIESEANNVVDTIFQASDMQAMFDNIQNGGYNVLRMLFKFKIGGLSTKISLTGCLEDLC